MKTIIAILFLGFTVNSFAQDKNPKTKSLVIEKGKVAPVKKNPPASTTTTPPARAKRTIFPKKQIGTAQPVPSNLER
jgi:hypothetical protein